MSNNVIELSKILAKKNLISPGITISANLDVANAYTVTVGAAGNSYAQQVGAGGNSYTVTVGAASNGWANAVGSGGNSYAQQVGTSGNSYAQQVGTAGNNWATSTFATLSNVAQVYQTTNISFNTANAAYAAANNITPQVAPSYNTANAAFDYANNIVVPNVTPIFHTANAAFSKANNIIVSIPSTSKGQSGDTSGMFSANNSYLYYCYETYTDGANNIWKRVQWSANTW